MGWPWPTHGLWRQADFLRLWAAQVGSAFGSRITRTVLPIIAILTLGASPTEVAVLSVMSVAPGVLVGLFVGGAVDRRSKRPLLIGADLLRAMLIFTVPLAAWWGLLSMWQLCLVAALVGAATTLFQIADSSYLPALVGAGHVLEGNAKLEATDSVAEAGGSAVAGVLVQVLSAPMALVFDGVSYLFSATMLARVRTRETPAVASKDLPSVWTDIAAGFRVCMSHRLVRALLLVEGVMAFFGGFFMALYMVLALQALALPPATVGLVIGVGGFAGALLVAPLGQWMSTTNAMLVCLALGAAANLLVPLSLQAGPLAGPALMVHQFVGDALLTVFLIHAVSLRQQTLPPTRAGPRQRQLSRGGGRPVAGRRTGGRPDGRCRGLAGDDVGRRHRRPARRAGAVAGNAVVSIHRPGNLNDTSPSGRRGKYIANNLIARIEYTPTHGHDDPTRRQTE